MSVVTRKKSLAGMFATKPVLTGLEEDPVRIVTTDVGLTRPVICTAQTDDVLLPEWVRSHRTLIDQKLSEQGAVLFRNFSVRTVPAFQEVVRSFSQETMSYTQRSSPRTAITSNIYTSTDHPADQVINMHNELSYAAQWPMKIMFGCMQPADQSGETPIADSRAVYALLRSETRSRFAQNGILYRRNLSGQMGLPWQEVFQTSDKMVVAQECIQNGMQFNWKSPDHLVIEWIRPAVVNHPTTGETLWFNHGFFFNANSLDTLVREVVEEEENLPFNTFYGDGSPIEQEVIDELRTAYQQATYLFPWQVGDCLLLDNMLVAHGRRPFLGNRKIIVGMWEPSCPAA